MIEEALVSVSNEEPKDSVRVRLPKELVGAYSLLSRKLNVPRAELMGAVLTKWREDETLTKLEEVLERGKLALKIDGVGVRLFSIISDFQFQLSGEKKEVKISVFSETPYHVPFQLFCTYMLSKALTSSPSAVRFGLDAVGRAVLEGVTPALEGELRVKLNWVEAIENYLE